MGTVGEAPGSFNFADVWEMAADAVPEREALVVGDQRRTYAQLEERVNRLANHFAALGVGPDDHAALYLENCAEYVEAMLALFKLRAVPINVNYRYVADELAYVLDNSDSVGLLCAETPGGGLPAHVRFVLTTGDDYEAALAAASPERPVVDGRSGDDRYVIYTGGTTGLPKGVTWRQEDAFFACIGGGDPLRLHGPAESPDELPGRILEQPSCYLPVAPMIHAAAQWTSLSWFFAGSKVVLMPGSLDPDAVWRAVEAEKVNVITVVGDAVARPLLDQWDTAVADGRSYDVSSLFVFSSGGAPLSLSSKERVFARLPNVLLTDGFGSSEAGTQGSSRVSAEDVAAAGTGRLVSFDRPAKPTIVLDPETGDEVIPGSGVIGQVLAGGRLPLGYYNDPERTAATFLERNGSRWLVTGDMATVEADGSISLVGRGSGAINTGGEKVFPEEVEAVLKTHPGVYDCVVVGVPDDRWGSAVTAVVHPTGAAEVTLEDLAAHCKQRLAGYKSPKRLVVVERIQRSPSGKADYRWAAEVAAAAGPTVL
ncbi:MAG TPA: acyl-CoA synthetase [Acidimicrobiales bacterium]|jgi:acyl-CoA synthetase (AMP-forming)/AMP-acid ligase II